MDSEPTCKHLRAKHMFISTAHETDPDPDRASRPQHCWCNCTLTEVGPDDRPAGAQVCTPERACFAE